MKTAERSSGKHPQARRVQPRPQVSPGGSPLYLANGAWDTVSLFLLRLLCHVAPLSCRRSIFFVSFWFLRLNRQAPTPFPLDRRHLALPPSLSAFLPAQPLAPLFRSLWYRAPALWSSFSSMVPLSRLCGSVRSAL